MSRLKQFVGFIVLSLGLTSCGFYSFTGASIPPEAKTISIQYFPNNAPTIVPTLSQTFTDMLKDKFTNQTSLKLIPRNGDLQLEGEITKYEITPVAIQGNDQAALGRLTITINVRFQNKYSEAQNYESSFSRFVDFPSSQSLDFKSSQSPGTVQESLIEEISKALTEDIFNKSVANW